LLYRICSNLICTKQFEKHYLNDVILFKNGGLLYGKILSIVDNVIEFEMISEKVVNIKMKQVKKNYAI